MNEKQIYLVKKESEKKKGVFYHNLYIDLGYQKLTISMDAGVIAQLLNVGEEFFSKLEIGKDILVAKLIRTVVTGK